MGRVFWYYNILASKNIFIFETDIDMKRTVEQNPAYPDCPVLNVLAKICDQRAILVLGTLWMSGKHAMRFTEIRKQGPVACASSLHVV